tara:strand:- start:182 stop:307 length:126 start_codon:yes stop_codon:yes gene_type:complete
VPGYYYQRAEYLKECIEALIPDLNPAVNTSLNPDDTPIQIN